MTFAWLERLFGGKKPTSTKVCGKCGHARHDKQRCPYMYPDGSRCICEPIVGFV